MIIIVQGGIACMVVGARRSPLEPRESRSLMRACGHYCHCCGDDDDDDDDDDVENNGVRMYCFAWYC